jgi:hypothetical protein
MTQLIDLIETERRRTEEQWEHLKARFDERFQMFDDMAEKARRLEEAEIDLKEPESEATPPKAKRASTRVQSVRDGDTAPGGPNDRKSKVLAALREAHPQQLRSKDLQKVVGLTSASGVRPLLDELIAEGKVVKSGQRAGTRYGLPDSGDPAEDERAIAAFLSTQRQPHSVQMITLKTKVPTLRAQAALNRMKETQAVHVVRIGSGDHFELVAK